MLFENKIYREKKQRKKSFSIIITFFVIFLLIISVLFYNSRKDIKIEINNNRETRFIGTIHIDDHFPSYTHRATNENQSIAIKSSSFNLNNFINQNIELIWHTEYSI